MSVNRLENAAPAGAVAAAEPGRPEFVVGPLGERLTLESLPPPAPGRWVIRRKAEVVAAVTGGLLTVDEACARYQLSLDEFVEWQRAVELAGMRGLRATSRFWRRRPAKP